MIFRIALLFVLLPLDLSGQQDQTVRILAELTNANGAPGFEGPVRDILNREWRGLLSNLHSDGLGNLLGNLPGQSDSPRVLLMAHMDEVGFLVRYIDDNGFVYVNPLGGFNDQSVLTQRFAIMTPRGPVVAYTGMKAPHITPGDEKMRMVLIQDMFLDVGAHSREEAEHMGIRPGLPVTFRTEFEILNGQSRYLAKAWDDRVGLAVINEVLQQLKAHPHPNNVLVAATVQEEIGLRGAAVVQASMQPDVVINFEIGIAGDFPLLTSPKLSQGVLGRGPAIFVFDGSMIPNNRLVEWVGRLAADNKIPIQYESVTSYGEDAAMLQRSAQGIPAVNIGIPTRYGHSQSGVIDRADFDSTVQLIVRIIERLSATEARTFREF